MLCSSIPSNIFALLLAAQAARGADLPTKRGLAYVNNDNAADNRLILSNNSEVSWYYTWSRNMARAVGDSIQFVPLVHNLQDAESEDLVSTLNRAPDSSKFLLTFNEPDGETDTGGSAISPEDAARAYIKYLAPLRTASDRSRRTWKVSHPSVTGSPRGLDWLRDFNESCWKIDSSNGCPTDFVAAHWYGDQHALQGWLGQLRDLYSNGSAMAGRGVDGKELKYWVTELALPQADADATLTMMRDSLEFLDGQDWVEAYAWFGAFRDNSANEWTGDEVALFDSGGGLTDLGALYLGGEERGFKKGMTGGAARLLSAPSFSAVAATLGAVVGLCLW